MVVKFSFSNFGPHDQRARLAACERMAELAAVLSAQEALHDVFVDTEAMLGLYDVLDTSIGRCSPPSEIGACFLCYFFLLFFFLFTTANFLHDFFISYGAVRVACGVGINHHVDALRIQYYCQGSKIPMYKKVVQKHNVEVRTTRTPQKENGKKTRMRREDVVEWWWCGASCVHISFHSMCLPVLLSFGCIPCLTIAQSPMNASTLRHCRLIVMFALQHASMHN